MEDLSVYYRNLADGCADKDEALRSREKALRCSALGTVVAVTKIEDIVKDRINDFKYSGLKDLLLRASIYSDITEWGNSNGVWELFVNFALHCRENGHNVFASTLFSVLKDAEPEEYWRQKAASLCQTVDGKKEPILEQPSQSVFEVKQ